MVPMPNKKLVDVVVIIPDASPVMTLARIGRLDLLGSFSIPVHIVDQVHYEITKKANDPDGKIAAALKRMGNQVLIVPTATGAGFKALRATNPDFPSKNLGEQAVDEYARRIARLQSPITVPLILFEDPDMLKLLVAQTKGVHLLNTKAWLESLGDEGLLPEAKTLVARIDALRKTAMIPIERGVRTRKIKSVWLRRSFSNDDTT
jgi:hypothetical protein